MRIMSKILTKDTKYPFLDEYINCMQIRLPGFKKICLKQSLKS